MVGALSALTGPLRVLTALVVLAVAPAFALDVNHASVDELQRIQGVGPKIAERIVRERRNGAFKSLEDLRARVAGVGEVTARNIASDRLSGSTASVGGGAREQARGVIIEVHGQGGDRAGSAARVGAPPAAAAGNPTRASGR